MNRTAAIYCRISRDTEGTALGVARQEADCRAFAERRGWNVAEVLIDNDVSAYSRRKRPGYDLLVEGVKNGEFDALVVWHPDRLHRRPAELEEFIDLVENTGIEIGTVTAGDWDLATPDGRLMARIVGSVARKESEDKSRRLRRKHEELAAHGKVSGGGRRPFGYEADKVTVRPDEAAEIRSAVARVIAGESLRSIAVEWNARGVETVTGAHWSPTTVRRLLQSARISGQREHNGKLTPAVWPAIITPEDTVRVRARLSRPASPTGRTPRKYLLTGLLRCGRCDSLMTTRPVVRKGHHYARYICAADRGGCGRCGISGLRLDEHVADLVLEALDTPGLTEVIESHEVSDGSVVAPVVDLERRLDELAEMFAAGEITRSEWLTARQSIEAQMEAARDELNAASTAAAAALLSRQAEDLRSRWADLPLGQRRAVVEAVVESVTIAPTTKANNRFDPDRVEVRWRA